MSYCFYHSNSPIFILINETISSAMFFFVNVSVPSNPGFEGMEKYTKKNVADEIVSFIKFKIGDFE